MLTISTLVPLVLCNYQVSPPYDVSDTTALQGLRIIVEALGSLVAHGKMGAHKHIIDKPFVPF
jgi:hypothetical protein